MILLQKGAPPQVLIVEGGRWTDDYVAAVARGEQKKYERWRHADVVKALRDETGGRCVYCEASVDDVSYPHVEHLLPKSLFPGRAHDWENLAWACERCNKSKGDYHHDVLGVVNPFAEDPTEFLFFAGAMVFAEPGKTRGKVTVTKLRLNREGLIRERGRRIESLHLLVEQWAGAEPPLRDVLQQAIIEDVNRGQFRQAATQFLRLVAFPVPAP